MNFHTPSDALTTELRETCGERGHMQSSYVYALLTKREVKMAGYWPSSFDFVSIHKNAKKNEANI